jgi:excisionase family DNA binding protein
MQRFLTVTEIAEHLRVKTATVYGWVYRRQIPFLKAGSRLLFDSDEITSWLAGRRHSPRIHRPVGPCATGSLRDHARTSEQGGA